MEKRIEILREVSYDKDSIPKVCYRLYSLENERRTPLALDGMTTFSISYLYDFIHSNGEYKDEEAFHLSFSEETAADLEHYMDKNAPNHCHGEFDFNPNCGIHLLEEVVDA